MSVKSTTRIMKRYWNSGVTDINLLADDVVFTMMANGQETRGPEAVLHMLKHLYRVAFDAQAEIYNEVIDDGCAVAEGFFSGIHIGEFAGIPVTGKEVHVPLCVSYELENDRIKRARIYLELPVLMSQLGVDASTTGSGIS